MAGRFLELQAAVQCIRLVLDLLPEGTWIGVFVEPSQMEEYQAALHDVAKVAVFAGDVGAGPQVVCMHACTI